MIELTNQAIDSLNIEPLRAVVGANEEFYRPSGVEHYRLLAYLSTCFQGRKFFDIGTHYGDSALALSYNETNHVYSFDVTNKVSEVRRTRQNVSYHISDLFDPVLRDRWKLELLGSALILIDVDPHSGVRELELIKWLQQMNYQGIFVLDDIWYFTEMRNHLWYKLDTRHKMDVTQIGHWSGTGIVSFASGAPVTVEGSVDLSNWTLVTGYFDLLGMPDATPEIRKRTASYYLEHARSVLALDKNLVVFCDTPQRRDQILAMRPKELQDRTRVIVMSFEDFSLTKYRNKIIANRGRGSCARDPRNTASYYLFCMARYAMLKRAIADNPFGSTHFGWINICIERMGFKNLIHLDEALSQYRDRFSTCYIDYVPKRVVQNLAEYFGPHGCKQCRNRCSMCSGFFTGNAKYMRAVCDQLEAQFVRCLNAGFGHADEQLYSLVYFEHPELFDWYIGDYSEMITNYAHVYDRADKPVVNLIRHSFEAQDWSVCTRACDILLKSHGAGKCALSGDHLSYLQSVRQTCKEQIGRQVPISPNVAP